MNEVTRWGKAMAIAAWIGVALLLTWLFSIELDHQEDPNRFIDSGTDTQTMEVVLERNRMGHYLVPGEINGQRVRFILDTGATVVSMPAEVANQLRLQRGTPGRAMTANGIVTIYEVMLDSVDVGGITLSNVRAHINPNMPGSDVLLGMSYLKEIEMIQRGDTLTLRKPR